MKKSLSFVVAAIILIGCMAVAIILVVRRPETVRQEVPPRAPFVTTVPVILGEGPIPIHGGGTVRPHTEVNVVAEVSGRVVWVNPEFQSGGRISSSEVLFRIDDADYLARVERARASLAAQEVEVMRVTAEAGIAKELFEEQEKSTPLALWEPQMEAVQAALSRDQAELDEAELHLSRTVVRAPFASTVLSESVSVGQFVAAGQHVGQLHGIHSVEVIVQLSDESAAMIPGLWEAGRNRDRIPARVTAQYGEHDYLWNGYVDRAKAALDQQTRTIEVVIRVPNPLSSGTATMDIKEQTPPLLIGKFVDVEIDGIVPDEYFRIRRSALRPGNEVWIVLNDVLYRVPVQVLQRSKDEVYLTGALKEGQEVVVGGIQAAIDGMAVRTGS